ncbi:MAG: NADH-quinone oxidoreductase subunit F [Candidatus Latescibacterota bacterium]|nr:MAG: NADH-quinone oxidoreductase subunit F [Candidatus Latescibacterota bacterium]
MVSPALLVAVPLGLAFALPLLRLAWREVDRYVPPVGMAFNLVVSLSLLPVVLKNPVVVWIGGNFPPPFCINLVAGPVGVLLSAVIALVGLLVAIYAIGYIREGDTGRYHTLYLLLLTGATGAVLTGDIFNLFVFFEILCISSYALVAYLGDRNGVEAAVKYLVQGSVGTGMVLVGIALLYGQFGTLNMADIAGRVNSVSPASVFVPLVLLVAGFGVEAAIFPLNAWLPDAHSSAPSSISAILSGIAIKVGVYAMARVIFTMFGASELFPSLMVVGLLTLFVGEMSAFAQGDIKRMLAYSSIGQIGLIAFALGLGTLHGLSGGMFQVVSHALSKSLLFLAVGYMIYRTGSMEISSLEGMGRRMPLTSLAFVVGAFSLVGFPPFVGFPSKFMIVKAAVENGGLSTVLVAVALVGTVIEGAYFLKVVQVMYFKGGRELKREEAPATALVPIFVLVLMVLVLGVYPRPMVEVLDSAASELLDRLKYVQWVMR